jgi:pyruvate,orthophosphate dikinase
MDLVLQVLQVKGQATQEALEAAVHTDVTEAIAELTAAGLMEPTRHGYRVTELGASRVDEVYAHEREQVRPVIEDVYESFVPINDEVKQIVTDWQTRTVGGTLTINDHSDRRYDERVISRLRRTDARVSTALSPLTIALSRFEVYPRRLRRALTLTVDGDHSMLAAPLKDSYHTVWFELHEELMVLSGRDRAAEEAG